MKMGRGEYGIDNPLGLLSTQALLPVAAKVRYATAVNITRILIALSILN